jgi:hypothetical protein
MDSLKSTYANRAMSSIGRKQSERLPIPWADVPHQELWQCVLNAMAFGSHARSHEDSVRYVLKRRLAKLDPTDHARYVELECQKIVETLRVVRDQYRTHLEKEGCKPIAEMYWVVFRLAVIPYAVKMLRETASDYIVVSGVDSIAWRTLYCYSPGIQVPLSNEPSDTKPAEIDREELVRDAIAGLVLEDTFEEVITGGPFGRDGQLHLGMQMPSVEFSIGQMTLMETIKLRQELWDVCRPWTEGLARMFDAAQEEVLCQNATLPTDGRQAAARFVSLSEFERVSYMHLVDMRQRNINSRSSEQSVWGVLFRELDKRQVPLDRVLLGKAKQVLDAARRKGHRVHTWEECYTSKVSVSLNDGKTYSLRREVTHALHNAAKKATYQLSKVWKV